MMCVHAGVGGCGYMFCMHAGGQGGGGGHDVHTCVCAFKTGKYNF